MIANEIYETKYTLLGSEFDQHVQQHPTLAAHTPTGALIVFLDKTEPEFSEWSLAHARQHAQIDDQPDRPVVYVDVKLAPRRSRQIRPRITRDPGKYKRQPVAAS
jgi:hypothetical protein